MKTLTNQEIIETIAAIKNVSADKVTLNDNLTFNLGKGVFMYDLTPKGTGVIKKSIKYFHAVGGYFMD